MGYSAFRFSPIESPPPVKRKGHNGMNCPPPTSANIFLQHVRPETKKKIVLALVSILGAVMIVRAIIGVARLF